VSWLIGLARSLIDAGGRWLGRGGRSKVTRFNSPRAARLPGARARPAKIEPRILVRCADRDGKRFVHLPVKEGDHMHRGH